MSSKFHEFVKAVIGVLRLGSELYTVATVEAIVGRLNADDYVDYMVYLSSRNSQVKSYEIPMEKLSNSVDEFIQEKYGDTIAYAAKLSTAYSFLLGSKKDGEELIDIYNRVESGYRMEDVSFDEIEMCRDIAEEEDIDNSSEFDRYLVYKLTGVKTKHFIKQDNKQKLLVTK